MKLDVTAIGLLNIDLIIHGIAPKNLEELVNWTGESAIECLTAGSIGYFIQNLTKLGLKTGVITNIGDDPFSLIIKKTLTDAGIDTSRLRTQENTKTAIGIYMLLFESKKRPMTFQLMTHDPMPTAFSKEDLTYIFNSRLLHVGGYLHFPQKALMDKLFKQVKNKGVKVSMDPQFPLQPLQKPWVKILPNLNNINILLVDENEALGLTNTDGVDEAADILLDKGVELLAIKLGANGCLVCSQTERFQKPAIPVENIVDSIGAGDAFDSGFITGYLEDQSLEKMTELALKVASYSLKGVGGSNTIPQREELSLD